jgi:DNA polymerase
VNREEKESLYQFLDTANRYLCDGMCASEPVPEFSDDPETLTVPDAPGMAAFGTLESIANEIAKCEKCRLAATRKHVVPGVGVERPVVMVIGEGPGADEDERGEPFVGKAGQLLDKMLASIELSRATNCFIANIVKCRPPQNRDPLPDETEPCSPFLRAQIALLKPVAILAVGRIAAQNLLATTDGIGKLRGRFFDYGGIPLFPTYHPSALLRDESLKRPAWEDLKAFKSKLIELAPEYGEPFRAGHK